MDNNKDNLLISLPKEHCFVRQKGNVIEIHLLFDPVSKVEFSQHLIELGKHLEDTQASQYMGLTQYQRGEQEYYEQRVAFYEKHPLARKKIFRYWLCHLYKLSRKNSLIWVKHTYKG